MKNGIRALAAACAVSVAATALVTQAQEAKQGVPANLQLQSFMAPVIKRNGSISSSPMTIVLGITDNRKAGDVCFLSPRVLDAVLQILYSEPLHMKDAQTLDLHGLDKKLAVASNEALEMNIVSSVHVFQGMKPSGHSARFARSTICGETAGEAPSAKEGEGGTSH